MSATDVKIQKEISQTILAAKNPAWDHQGDQDSLEKQLSEDIKEIVDMRVYLPKTNKIAHFAGEVYLVILNNGAKAVWKPRSGNAVNCAYAEVAAYHASRWLAKHTGCHLVPPTVIRNYENRIGSLQWFVESELDLWVDEQRALAYANLNWANLAFGAAFIHVLGQWDTHPGNEMMAIDGDGKTVLALIDNECIANRKYSASITERPFVRMAYAEGLEDSFTDSPTIIILKTPTMDQFKNTLKPFNLPIQQLDNLYDWMAGNGTRDVKFAIWNGCLWLQYHQKNLKAFPNHVKHYPNWVVNAFNNLDLAALQNIFSLGIAALPKHFNQVFLQEILLRRTQLMEFVAANNYATDDDTDFISKKITEVVEFKATPVVLSYLYNLYTVKPIGDIEDVGLGPQARTVICSHR